MRTVIHSAERTLDAASATWVTHKRWDGAMTLERVRASRDSRLNTLLGVGLESDAPPGLGAWLAAQVDDRVGQWRAGSGSAGEALALAQGLAEQELFELPADWLEALKRVVTLDPWGPYEWQLVVSLGDLEPEIFDAQETAELTDQFRRSAEAYLFDNADSLDSRDEVEEMSALAEHFGTTLDRSWVERAESELGEKAAQQDERDELELERWREEDRPTGAGERSEIDRIFERLAED